MWKDGPEKANPELKEEEETSEGWGIRHYLKDPVQIQVFKSICKY